MTREVIVDYTNHAGVRAKRRIEPIAFHFKETKWHPEPQWIVHAFDVEKSVMRFFALKDIHSWTPVSP